VKKVLIGVGLGCGGVIFVGVIALMAGGMWFKGKAQGLAHDAEQVQSLEQRVVELNQRYAFTEPPKGQPLQLSERRLQDYLQIRLVLKPLVDGFQARARQFEPPKGEPSKQPDLSRSLQALGMMTEMRSELSSKWLDELERQGMSPREFRAITVAVYTPPASNVNATLLDRYAKKIGDASSTGLDSLLVGNATELGATLQDAFGGEGSGPGSESSK
jgi:hypothetical protein